MKTIKAGPVTLGVNPDGTWRVAAVAPARPLTERNRRVMTQTAIGKLSRREPLAPKGQRDGDG